MYMKKIEIQDFKENVPCKIINILCLMLVVIPARRRCHARDPARRTFVASRCVASRRVASYHIVNYTC